MAANRPLALLPLIAPRTAPAEKSCLCRFSVLSALVHAMALSILLTLAGGRTELLPPARVITIDLAPLNYAPSPPLPPAAHPQPRTDPGPPPPPATGPARHTARALPNAPSATTATMPGVTEGPPAVAPFSPSGREFSQAVPTVSPAATAPPPSSRAVEAATIRTAYMQRCRGLIERHKDYPVMARRGRIEGTTVVRGTLDRDGSLRQCLLARTSGSALLDNAAIRAVRSAGQFPPIPAELQGAELVFELPISFRLSVE
jgi:protein TonB